MSTTPSDVVDVFLSFSGEDRSTVRELKDALTAAGLKAFLDEDDIRFSHNISDDVQEALRRSKTMLIYYSASYPTRSACQFELHHTYLSALRTGEVAKRLLVVNPEDPATEHLLPLDLMTHRYWRAWRTKGELSALVSGVARAARAVDTPFADIDFAASARRVGRTSHLPNTSFVGRYRDRWRLHAALHIGDQPLVAARTAPPVVALTGMPGIGKSALVRAYEHDFGFLYPGGVHRISLAGSETAAEARSAHTEQLVRLAEFLDERPPDVRRDSLLAWWSQRLDNAGEPVLWVVDDVPGALPDEVLAELVPSARGVRTLLVSQREIPESVAQRVRLGGLTADDGRALFTRHHPAGPDERDAVARVVEGLGGHPYAIALAAAGARGREGLWHLRDRVKNLTRGAPVLDMALKTVRGSIAALTRAERVVLTLSAVCSARPLPAVFISRVLDVLAPDDRDRANEVLASLERAMLVESRGGSWQVHQLVRAATRQGGGSAELDTVAAVAAHTLIALAKGGVPGLVEHGVALLDRTSGSPTYADELNRLAVTYYDNRGEPASAAPFHERLADLHPNEPSHLLNAARARRQSGGPEAALAHLNRLASTAHDSRTAVHGEAMRAAVFDDLGRHLEAEALWAQVFARLTQEELPREEVVDLRTARIRNRRMLGYYLEAKALLRDLIAEHGDMGDALIPARLELAEVGVATDDREGAREAVRAILDHYEGLGLPRHANAITAATLLHQAQLTVFILESYPTQAEREGAERALHKQLEASRRELGPHNPRTLAIAVTHLEALIRLGTPERALAEYASLPDELAAHLGPGHDRRLRALYLLGLAQSQRGDYAAAAVNYRNALQGQLTSLGRGHPETLETTYELGVCQWFEGDRGAARAAFHTVMEGAVEKVGRRNDLYGKALVAAKMIFIPAPIFRAAIRFDRRRKD
ncbi:TIR domain-containing protein [Actinosynnema sp. NPDC091369]